MEISMRAPATLLIVFGGVIVVALLAMLLKRGDWVRKGIALVILVVVTGGLLIFLYRPTYLRINSDGIASNGLGNLQISWSDVKKMQYVSDLGDSPFQPTSRIFGTAVGAYRTGTFKLRSGTDGRVLMQQDSSALVVETAKSTFVFAPDDVRAIVAEAAKYGSVTDWSAQ